MFQRLIAALVFVLLAQPLHDSAYAQRQGGQGGRGSDAGRGGALGGLRGRGAEAQPSGSSIIRGRIVAADTGTPVRRAQVRATSSGGRGAHLATSDAEGRFELRDLPAGRWLITVSKGGFITQQFGQRRAYDTPDPIELADGQRFTADFRLSRGGVITGRVFDEFDDPITGARVQVMRSQMRQGRRQLVSAATADQTDDTGAFRIFGLPPGDYYIAGNLRVAPLDSTEGAVTYAPTYYPGTGTLGDAQRISLGAGEEQTNLNFVLLPVRAVRVSGTVVNSSGEPMPAVANLIAAGGADDGPPVTSAGRADATGSFTIANVVPGSYLLNVNGRRGPHGDIEMASVPVIVGDSDLTGIAVVTSRGGIVRGSVTFEGPSKPATTGLRVTAQSLRPAGSAGASQAQVSNTGSFELTGLLGPYALRVTGLAEGWMVKAINANGADVADSPLDVRGGEQLIVRVVLTDRITEINGSVRSGTQPAEGSVVIFPDDPEKWAFPSRYVQVARTTSQGGYTVRALPPGQRYLAAAVDYLEQGEQQDPEFLERIRARASSVSLSEGERKTLDLTLLKR